MSASLCLWIDNSDLSAKKKNLSECKKHNKTTQQRFKTLSSNHHPILVVYVSTPENALGRNVSQFDLLFQANMQNSFLMASFARLRCVPTFWVSFALLCTVFELSGETWKRSQLFDKLVREVDIHAKKMCEIFFEPRTSDLVTLTISEKSRRPEMIQCSEP